jgi:hypothetical protein
VSREDVTYPLATITVQGTFANTGAARASFPRRPPGRRKVGRVWKSYAGLIVPIIAAGFLAACGAASNPIKSGAVTAATVGRGETAPMTCTSGTETTHNGKYQYGQCIVALPVPTSHSANSKTRIVLGSRRFGPPACRCGWGTSAPPLISNGGDPSGTITHVHWRSWGGEVAAGRGLNAIFAPGGGYYPHPVVIYLRAYDLGRCTPSGPLSYRKLEFREPSRPNGPLRPWADWGGALPPVRDKHTLCSSSP